MAAEVFALPGAGRPDIAPDTFVPEVVAELEQLLERARAGEIRAIGWAVVLRDRITDAEWTDSNYSPELFAAAVSQRTSRIKLGMGVVSLPYHNPFMVADRIRQLDHITKGRTILGMGPGSLPSDAYMIGVPTSEVRDRMEQAIDPVRPAGPCCVSRNLCTDRARSHHQSRGIHPRR